MALADLFNMSVEIWRRSAGAENDYGEAKDTWSKQTDLTCTLQPKTGDVAREENGVLITSSHVLYCIIGANIRVGDKVKKDSNEYDVLFTGNSAGRFHHLKVSLRLME